MLKNYFKLTLRHLWRNRLFTVLNILGLTVGISFCWIIYQIVDYEFSFDQKHPNVERIYQFINMGEYEGKVSGAAGITSALPLAVRDQVTGVEQVVPVYHKYDRNAIVPDDNKGALRTFEEPKHQVFVSESYFEMVPYRWMVGNPTTAFNAPNQVVLTKSRAEQYFPNVPPDDLLGRTITYNDTVLVSISGIVADLDFPSSFNAQEFFAIAAHDWNSTIWLSFNSNNNLFVKLAPNASIESILTQVNAISHQHTKEVLEEIGRKQWYDLVPLAEKHFISELAVNSPAADKKVLYGLIGVAAFILLLACINYINLSTAQVPQRAKEIGIHKTLGSRPSQLINKFLGETFFITLFAALLSFAVSAFALRLFSDFIPEGMQAFQNYTHLALFLIALILLITVLSGIYPAWLITRVQTINVLKGQSQKVVGETGFNLRKGLIVFQFIIAQVFVIAAIIIGQQLQHTLNKNLGFDREAVFTIYLPFLHQNAENNKQIVLKQELAKNSNISAVAIGDKPLSDRTFSTQMTSISDTGKVQRLVYYKIVDEDFLDLYDFKVLAGSKLAKSDTLREYVINETAVKTFGFESPEQAIGKQLEARGRSYPIVGVVNDFHHVNFKQEISPIVFESSQYVSPTVNVKLAAINPQQWQRTLGEIEQTWKSVYPDAPFEYQFYDETIAKLYEGEHKTSKLVSLATGITIVISCLGLFGLATLTTSQRVKEIGIRKVLGASIAGIIKMLSLDFVKLVFIAILIASPIAWWAMNKWLEDFVYRIDIEWWMFAVAGMVAVVIALLTVSMQAVKAAVANPVDSLRDE